MRASSFVDGYNARPAKPGILREPRIASPMMGTVSRYVDILNDKCFKYVLGEERNKEALMALLRVLIPERVIIDIHYDKKKRKINPFIDGHDAIFDVECVDADGTRFVVEMQRWEQTNFYDRAVFYGTFPIQEQIPATKKGKVISHNKQFDFPAVYIVNLMAFSLHPRDNRILYRFELKDTVTGEKMTDKLTFIFLEMSKVRDKPGSDADVLEKLSWAMMNMSTLKERPDEMIERIFSLLFEACEIERYEPEQRTNILNAMTTELDKSNIAYTYWMKGKEEGWEEGREEGMEEGMEIGRDRANASTARALLGMGMKVEDIARATGLSEENILSLRL